MIKNELRPEFLGIHAFNAFAKNNSGSRAVMFGGHFSQRLVLDHSMPNRIQTGIEQEFGKYTFAVKMPENGRIIKTIQRYPMGVDVDSLDYNPETIVIYENDETGEIDYFSITNFQSYHQIFGFKNVFKQENINMLRPNSFIPKGTVFAHSPGVGENDNYMYGVEFNTAFMSLPAVAEDGFVISRSALKKLVYRTYETRRISFGSSSFALNLYGTTTNYKPFPDIGENIREDGLLVVTRPYDTDLVPAEMSIYDTMEPDFYFDTALYTKAGKGRIVDIQVISNNNADKQLPEAMAAQLQKYTKANIRFHREIVEFEQKLRYDRKKKFGEAKLKLSPKLRALIVTSLAIINYYPPNAKDRQPLNLLYRKEPVDEYMVEFTIEYENIPDIGSKLTDISGGKGVICKIEEDENMPVDAAGNRAEIVSDPVATLNRMNLARLHSHYHGSVARDVTDHVRRLLAVTKDATKEQIELLDEKLINEAHNLLVDYYGMVSERQESFYRNLPMEQKIEHVFNVVTEGIFLYIPIENQKDSIEMIKDVERNLEKRIGVKPVYGPVSYVGNSGQRCVTTKNVRIGPMYFMLLDKTTTEWSATSSAKLQHFGVLTPLTKSEKFSRPYRNSPTRTIGETEGRIYRAYGGPYLVAELFDRSNNPSVQKHIIRNILTADKPGNIEKIVDRNYYPYGNSRSLANVMHIFTTAGFKITYVPEDETTC